MPIVLRADDINEMKLLNTMLLLLGEVMVDAGKVRELKARRPLSPPVAPLMRGRRAEGVRSGKWLREGRRRQ